MSTGIFLERFLLVFVATIWGLYMLDTPMPVVGGVGALMLAVGAVYSFVHVRRSVPGGPR